MIKSPRSPADATVYELTNFGFETAIINSSALRPEDRGRSFTASMHDLCEAFLPTTPRSAGPAVASASKRVKAMAFKTVLDHRLTMPTQSFSVQTFVRGYFESSFVESCETLEAPFQMTTGGLATAVGDSKARRLEELFERLDEKFSLLVEEERKEGEEDQGPTTPTVAKLLHLLASLRREDAPPEVKTDVVPYKTHSSPSRFHRHFNVDVWVHERDIGRKWPSTTIHFGPTISLETASSFVPLISPSQPFRDGFEGSRGARTSSGSDISTSNGLSSLDDSPVPRGLTLPRGWVAGRAFLPARRRFYRTEVGESPIARRRFEAAMEATIDVKYLLLGVNSATFRWSRRRNRFHQCRPLPWPSPLVDELLQIGASMKRLETFCGDVASSSSGLILRAFAECLSQVLRFVHAIYVSLPADNFTVLQLYNVTGDVAAQVKFLSDFCHGLTHRLTIGGGVGGLDLLSRVYDAAVLASASANGLQPLLLALLSATLAPLLRSLGDWIFQGDLADADNEFFVKRAKDDIPVRDPRFLSKAFVLRKSGSRFIPDFLQPLLPGILSCGKCVVLMRVLEPNHFVVAAREGLQSQQQQQQPPKPTLTFCPDDIAKIVSKCRRYSQQASSQSKSWNDAWRRRRRRREEEELEQRRLARRKALRHLELKREREDRAREEEEERRRGAREALRRQMRETRDKRSSKSVDEEASGRSRKRSISSDNGERTTTTTTTTTAVEGESTDDLSLELLEDFALSEPGTSASSSTSGSLGQSNGDTSDESLSCRAIVEGDSSESFRTALEQQMQPDGATATTSESALESDATFVTGRTFRSDVESDTNVSEQMVSESRRLEEIGTIPEEAEAGEEGVLFDVAAFEDLDADRGGDAAISRPTRRGDWASGRDFQLLGFEAGVGEVSDPSSPTPTTTSSADAASLGPRRSRLSSAASSTSSADRSSSSSLSSVLEAGETRRRPPEASRRHWEMRAAAGGYGRHRLSWMSTSSESGEEMFEGGPAAAALAAEARKTRPTFLKIGEVDDGEEEEEEGDGAKSSEVPGAPGAVTRKSRKARTGVAAPTTGSSPTTPPGEERTLVPSDPESSDSDTLLSPPPASSSRETPPPPPVTTATTKKATSLRYRDDYNSAFSEPPTLQPPSASTTSVPRKEKSIDLSLPLASVLEKCVVDPIRVRVDAVNSAVLNYFLLDLQLMDHFLTLRRFMLLEDGEFAETLSESLFDRLQQVPALGDRVFNPVFLEETLRAALTASTYAPLLVDASAGFASTTAPPLMSSSSSSESAPPASLTDNLALSLSDAASGDEEDDAAEAGDDADDRERRLLNPDDADCLLRFRLDYDVRWPLNMIVTRSALSKYNRVFGFVLQMKYAAWALKDVFYVLKVAGVEHNRRFRPEDSVDVKILTRLQLYRHEMFHFVRVLQGFVANRASYNCWEEFCERLRANSRHVDDLHAEHSEFLSRALHKSLLSTKCEPLRRKVGVIFSCILKFRSLLKSSEFVVVEAPLRRRTEASDEGLPSAAAEPSGAAAPTAAGLAPPPLAPSGESMESSFDFSFDELEAYRRPVSATAPVCVVGLKLVHRHQKRMKACYVEFAKNANSLFKNKTFNQLTRTGQWAISYNLSDSGRTSASLEDLVD